MLRKFTYSYSSIREQIHVKMVAVIILTTNIKDKTLVSFINIMI